MSKSTRWTEKDLLDLKSKGYKVDDIKVVDAEIVAPKKNTMFIGIDPDVEKSGVAFKHGDIIELSNLSFFDLYNYLLRIIQKKVLTNDDILVVVEGGWLNKGFWHKKNKGSASLNAKIGASTGANHETGKKIVEMLDYLDLPYKIIKPTKSKVNAKTFKNFTKIKRRTNQEQRDAFMLIYGM